MEQVLTFFKVLPSSQETMKTMLTCTFFSFSRGGMEGGGGVGGRSWEQSRCIMGDVQFH